MNAENENEPKSNDAGAAAEQTADASTVVETAGAERGQDEIPQDEIVQDETVQDNIIQGADGAGPGDEQDAADASAGDPAAAAGETVDADDGLSRDVERLTALFTRSQASVDSLGGAAFRFARWSRPVATAFFGFEQESVAVMQSGFREAADLAGVSLATEDDAFGANILVYAVEDWRALRDAPQLGDLIPDLDGLIRLLSVADANQYRIFTFTPEDGLQFCVALLRYDAALSKLSAPSLALGQAVQTLLLWSDEAFASESPVTVRRGGKALVKSRFARLLKAAYAPETPAYSEDPAFAAQLAEQLRAARGAGEGRESEADARDEGGAPDAAKSEGGDRRRRPRRRRGRAEDDAGPAGSDRAGSASADSPDEGQSGPEAAPAFDPLGGDPRPMEESASDAASEDEDRSS